MRKLTVGSLFAGIGGLELGLEMTGGFETVWQVEIDDYARKVLAKHWPNVRRHDDVRTFPPEGEWGCDVICGGFPCQDISNAGQFAGIDGERSGLWSEIKRVASLLRPRFIVVENVAALLGRGMGRVLGDLSEIGYDAEWETLSACAFGAPHMRRRVFIVAHDSQRVGDRVCVFGTVNAQSVPQSKQLQRVRRSFRARFNRNEPDADFSRLSKADGLSERLGEIAGYGNAVVPQVAQWIGQRILDQNGG